MNHDRRVTFTADGRRIEAKEGQSIAAALWAHGDRTLSRSMKYHRPRGWSCGIGRCNDCAMRVDGVPNLKTCVTPATDGIVVEGQNAWPNVRRDLFRVNDLVFYRGLDHHTSFVKPRFLYPLFTKVMRGFAGWGRLPDAVPDPPATEALKPDVLVVGGGPAGLAAAAHAADAGAEVLLIEEAHTLGGHATRMGRQVTDPDVPGAEAPDPAEAIPVTDLVARWRNAVTTHARIQVRTGTSLSAAYGNGLMLASAPDRITALRPRATVIATGGYASMGSFENNDLPGVMTAGGAQALLNQHGVRPGRRIIIYGAGAHGCQAALDLHEAGIEVAAIIEPADTARAPRRVLTAVEAAGIPLMTDRRVTKVRGIGRVRGVRLDDGTTLRADTLVVALGQKTTPEAFQSMGCALRYRPDAGGAVPVLSAGLETSVAGLFAAGDAAGIGSLATARASGALAGLGAARHAGHAVTDDTLGTWRERLRGLSDTDGGPLLVDLPPLEVNPVGP